MQKYYLLIITLVILVSCGKGAEGSSTDDNSPDDISTDDNYLILGLTFGECGEDCAYFFKLDKDKVYSDAEDGYWAAGGGPVFVNEEPDFKDEPMDSMSVHAEMVMLESQFPDYLEKTDENVFGCPDCADGGALHIFKKIDGERQYWTLDNDLELNPEEIQEWIKSVQTLIHKLIN